MPFVSIEFNVPARVPHNKALQRTRIRHELLSLAFHPRR